MRPITLYNMTLSSSDKNYAHIEKTKRWVFLWIMFCSCDWFPIVDLKSAINYTVNVVKLKSVWRRRVRWYKVNIVGEEASGTGAPLATVNNSDWEACVVVY